MPFQSITKVFHVAHPFSLFLGMPPSLESRFFRMPPLNPTSPPPPSLVKNERSLRL